MVFTSSSTSSSFICWMLQFWACRCVVWAEWVLWMVVVNHELLFAMKINYWISTNNTPSEYEICIVQVTPSWVRLLVDTQLEYFLILVKLFFFTINFSYISYFYYRYEIFVCDRIWAVSDNIKCKTWSHHVIKR